MTGVVARGTGALALASAERGTLGEVATKTIGETVGGTLVPRPALSFWDCLVCHGR
jgi:hypothetical protein